MILCNYICTDFYNKLIIIKISIINNWLINSTFLVPSLLIYRHFVGADEMVGQYPKEEQQLVIKSSYGSDSISSCSVIQNNQGDELWALNSADFYLTTNNNTSALKSGIRFCSESSSEGDNP